MRTFIAVAAVAGFLATSVSVGAAPSNPNCVADDVTTIRAAFGGPQVGALFSELGRSGTTAEVMRDFRSSPYCS